MYRSAHDDQMHEFYFSLIQFNILQVSRIVKTSLRGGEFKPIAM